MPKRTELVRRLAWIFAITGALVFAAVVLSYLEVIERELAVAL